MECSVKRGGKLKNGEHFIEPLIETLQINSLKQQSRLVATTEHCAYFNCEQTIIDYKHGGNGPTSLLHGELASPCRIVGHP